MPKCEFVANVTRKRCEENGKYAIGDHHFCFRHSTSVQAKKYAEDEETYKRPQPQDVRRESRPRERTPSPPRRSKKAITPPTKPARRELTLKRNSVGVYVDKETGYVFDSDTKVIGTYDYKKRKVVPFANETERMKCQYKTKPLKDVIDSMTKTRVEEPRTRGSPQPTTYHKARSNVVRRESPPKKSRYHRDETTESEEEESEESEEESEDESSSHIETTEEEDESDDEPQIHSYRKPAGRR
jgi:hypothetical protein